MLEYSGYSNSKWLFWKQTKNPRELTERLESSKISRAAAECSCTGPEQAPVGEEQQRMGSLGNHRGIGVQRSFGSHQLGN